MSTQILTELPNIQKTGMDFDTVISEIRNIIQDNPNWNKNWPEFYDSEAGVMLTQLMAWITDNLSTRQDMLYNEMFINTAQKDVDKIRHLKQIGYIPQMPHSAKTRIKITLNKLANDKVVIVPANNNNLINRTSEIAYFEGRDINGKPCPWEILKITNGKPDYLKSIILPKGDTEYRFDIDGNELYAIQGKTLYEEFFTDTSDGSNFTLKEKNIASDSIQVYLKVEQDIKQLQQVNSFVSQEALDEKREIPFILELNEDSSYRIRFPSKGMLPDTKLLKAGSTISVFYRTCNGNLGNIRTNVINKETSYNDIQGETYSATLSNEYPGFGGSDKETLDQAILNGPVSLRTMDRAVTPEDYNIILNRNTNVFKTKTYTASNMPENFKEYYGRYINPQESFTFAMLHKNYSGVPASKYNYFPWLSSIKQPRMNEKYIFDNASFNKEIDISRMIRNLKISVDGSIKTFRNATVLNLGEEFNNSIYVSEGKLNDYIKAKITKKLTDKLYFNDINFELFDDKSFSIIDTDKNSYISMDDNAKFIAPKFTNTKEPINVAQFSNLNFVINDELEINVKLDAEASESLTNYYIYWDNDPKQSTIDYSKDETKSAADYRKGVVQLINETINNAISIPGKFKNFEETSKQFFGLRDVINPSNVLNCFSGYSIEDSVEFTLSIKGVDYLFTMDHEYKDPSSSIWGSLNYLKNFLNNCFKNNNAKKYESGEWIQVSDGELSSYESGIINKSLFETDYYEDNKDSGYTKLIYDIYIGTSDKKNLTTISFRDYEGFNHTLYEVVNIQDPASTIDGEGLVKILTGRKGEIGSVNYPCPTQSTSYNNLARMEYKNEERTIGRLCLYSPTIGISSTIYFKRNTNNFNNDFATNYLNINFIDGFSYKVYGVKKAYLIKNEILSSIEGVAALSDVKLEIGNIIFENSNMYNSTDFEDLFASYKLKENNKLLLGSVYDNYYNMGDESDENLKERNIAGITGQYINSYIAKSGRKVYYIDPNKSKFDIKFTKDIKNTNSIFSIKNDEDGLGVIPSDRVEVKTYDIGALKDCSKLIIKFDNYDPIRVDTTNIKNAIDLSKAIKNIIKNSNGQGNRTLKENIDSIVSIDYDSIKRIIFTSIKNNNGNVSFIYDESSTKEQNDNLYKLLFGNNETNSTFYKLYPKEDENFKNFIVYENEEKTIYHYCPNTEGFLKFEYKKLIIDPETKKEISKNPDYYIDVKTTKKLIEGSTDDDFVYRYEFYIMRTENSHFPDNYFYVHFVNDKTYDFDDSGKLKENDETMLQDYMNKYKISGTEITMLQPYFKTYDIAAEIFYNGNFNETEIINNVKKAIDDLCSLEKSEISNSISKAKIFKAIMNCDGVEDCDINYFGYDYSLKKENSEVLKADFYEILCLHEDDKINNKHGKILTFTELQ